MVGFGAAVRGAAVGVLVCLVGSASAWAECSTDLDGDGFGEGDCGSDCDDGDPDVYPGAPEICDGKDSDCDGVIHLDGGYQPTWTESVPSGEVRANRYRADVVLRLRRLDVWLEGGTGSTVFVALEEGEVLTVVLESELELQDDGWSSTPFLELDVERAARFWVGVIPDGGAEIGHTTERGVPDATDFGAWLESRVGAADDLAAATTSMTRYAIRLGYDDEMDGDGDGVPACEDCDDGDPLRFPGAEEECDGFDGDCDGVLPDWDRDDDGDGAPVCAGDCDDEDARVGPDFEEVCDGVDNDCDGAPLDEEVEDADDDGFAACLDCEDGDSSTYPGAPEACDAKDNDCDGLLPLIERDDADGDGGITCADCNDEQPQVFRGAPERCDGLDNDCDEVLPEDEVDEDGDGWLACAECDDADAENRPGQEEVCDGEDADCSGGLTWRMEGELIAWATLPPGLIGWDVRPRTTLFLQELRTWIRPVEAGAVGHVVYRDEGGVWEGGESGSR